jgi:tetratricopeptide (TPR) repeat protein
MTAAGLTPSLPVQAAPFEVHFRKPNPFDPLLKLALPGTDEFAGEKAAAEVEARMMRVFQGTEKPPVALESFVQKVRRDPGAYFRFYALPESRVRFEVTLSGQHQTGIWQLPEFREVWHHTQVAAKPYFVDATGHAFGHLPSFRDHLQHGNNYWRARLDSAVGIDVFGNQGIAAGDIDNDGVDEIYVCQPGGLPNRLYKFRSDGTAEDITERAGLAILDESTSALFVDFRNSGHQDLVVLRGSGPLLFLNQGDGTFREHPDAFRFRTPAQGSFTGMAAADFDRDGKVDLYLCCYVYFQSEDQYQYPAPYQDARNGPPNFLFRNLLTKDGGVFEDVTAEVGLGENNDRFSFAATWMDVDGDGWPDLHVVNDFGRDNLYRNRNGHFRDEAAQAGVDDAGPGMSSAWFDYDGDGKPDLYVSNMWTAAGQRVIADPGFAPRDRDPEAWSKHAKGNSLFRNRGDGTFEDTGAAQNVEMGRWAWGSGGFDFDMDGRPEIFVATGMVSNGTGPDLESFFWRQVVAKTPAATGEAPAYENGWNALNQMIREDWSWSGNQRNVYYVPSGGGYQDASGVSGLDFADDTRSFAVTDFDGDGCPDLILKNRLGPQIRAMRNNAGHLRARIGIALRGVRSNRDAIGARVAVNGLVQGKESVQWLQAGSGFLSQHSKTLYFPLLEGPGRAEVRVDWPSGLRQVFPQLREGGVNVLTEGLAETAFRPFLRHSEWPVVPVTPRNAPEPADVWLREPVPTPERHAGPAFLVLHAGQRVPAVDGVRVEAVDLGRAGDDAPAIWTLFRRYLLEYRAPLTPPMTVLVDSESRARKVYAGIPAESTMLANLRQIDRNRELAVPFAGKYYSEPRRSYFKFGAAFYWAGYPDRALPYLEEAVRARPDNWKALIAAARIRQELGRHREAVASFEGVLAIRPGYAPAMEGAGESWIKLGDRARAKAAFERAVAADAKCADAWNQLGILAGESNDLGAARGHFERAIEARRDHTGAINNLGVLFAKLGQANDSVAAFRYGITVDPEDEQLYMNLTRVYVTMGQREQAAAVLRQLMERKPGNAMASRALRELEGR